MLYTYILLYNKDLVNTDWIRSSSVLDKVASIEYYAALDNPANMLG